MSETKWTPAPWIVAKGAGWIVTRPAAAARRESALAVGLKPDASLVNDPHWPENDEEARANAYLMAAAPELYEALNVLTNEFIEELGFDPGNGVNVALDRARAALAKVSPHEHGNENNA